MDRKPQNQKLSHFAYDSGPSSNISLQNPRSVNVQRLNSNSSLPTASNYLPESSHIDHTYHPSLHSIRSSINDSNSNSNDDIAGNSCARQTLSASTSLKPVKDFNRLESQNGYPMSSEQRMQYYGTYSTGCKMNQYYDDAESSDSSFSRHMEADYYYPSPTPGHMSRVYSPKCVDDGTVDRWSISSMSTRQQNNFQPIQENHQLSRQLPSMSAIAAGANYMQNTSIPHRAYQHNLPPQLGDLNLADQQSLQGTFPPAQLRSLPPMSMINGAGFRHQQAPAYKQNLYSSEIPQQPISWPSCNFASERKNSPEPSPRRRKLPIVTPFGPQPINQPMHRQPLKQIQDTTDPFNGYSVAPTYQADSQIALKAESFSRQPRSIEPVELLQTATVKYLSNKIASQNSSSNVSSQENRRPPSQRQPTKVSHPKRNTDEHNSSAPVPARKLPIITRQGVLRLREFNSGLINGPVEGLSALRRVSTERGQLVNQNSEIISVDNRERDSLRESISLNDKQRHSSDIDYDNAEEDASFNEDADVLDDREYTASDGNSFVESEADKNVTTSRSDSNLGDVNDEIGTYSEAQESETKTDMLDYPTPQEDTVVDDEDDGISMNEKGYFDTQSGQIQEEEAEYFSALATVPEEEGKFSDKDNSQEYEHQDEPNSSKENYVDDTRITISYNNIINNNNNNNNNNLDQAQINYIPSEQRQLPTIVESSGFEAQVIDYIAGKNGMRRGQLFCVDEEPSSCNEDVDVKESLTTPGNEYHQPQQLEIMRDDEAQIDHHSAYRANDDVQQRAVDQDNRIILQDNKDSKNETQDSIRRSSKEQQIQQQLMQAPNLQVANPAYLESEIESSSFQSVNEQLLDNSNMQYQFQMKLDNDHQLGQSDLDREQYVLEANVPTLTVSDATQGHTGLTNTEQQLYDGAYQDQNMDSYDSEKDEDGKVLMSKMQIDKNVFDQEDCDEQYRDINNLDDLDRRATNHVHAIDGHSKSMLNDIHQQRTIVDYFDEVDYATNKHDERFDESITQDQNCNFIPKEEEVRYGTESPLDQQEQAEEILDGSRLEDSNYQADSNVDGVNLTPEVANQRQVASSAEQDYGSDLPRARMRWIQAVNKIVNRSGEVSILFQSVKLT